MRFIEEVIAEISAPCIYWTCIKGKAESSRPSSINTDPMDAFIRHFTQDGLPGMHIHELVKVAGEMKIKKVQLLEKYRLHDYKTRKLMMGDGSSNLGEEEKTILVVGQTGSGKTTIIDGMFNYITGVKWEDEFRWKLTDMVSEEEAKSSDDTVSHTEWITVYSLPKIQEGILPYCLNIIDTPGFGDTRGIEFDQKLVKNLDHFFNNPEQRHGITSIDGICLVAKAPDGRLTDSQSYVFNSIMSIFGKDVKDNIFAFATFADGKKPKVYQAFKKADIPVKQSFKFNNSALFTDNGTESGSDSEDDLELDKKYWDIGKLSYAKFFEHLLQVQPKSTKQTANLLHERQILHVKLENIKKDINAGFLEMTQLLEQNKQLSKHQKEVESFSDYRLTQMKRVDVEVQNTAGSNALYCK